MVSTYAGARDAFRQRHLRQALYDAGEVVMADVLVNLHGEAHRDRRRLENRLFRRDTHTRYERSLFPPIVDSVLAPHLHSGRAELVELSHNLMMHLAAATAGVDRPLGTAEETDRLYQAMMQFIAGAPPADQRSPPHSSGSTSSSSHPRSNDDDRPSPVSPTGPWTRTTSRGTC
jgi:cytochrome P450